MVGRYAGETPGADIHESRASKCRKCGGDLLLGLVRNAKGTLRWRNFDAKPNERGGLRYYLRHICPAK
jgi:hypothetical protein